MVSILLAHPQPLIRDALANLLRSEPNFRIVAETSDGGSTVDAIEEQRPQVAIVNSAMPSMPGVEVARMVGKGDAKTRVLVLLSTAGESMMLHKDGTQTECRGREELVGAVRAAAASGEQGRRHLTVVNEPSDKLSPRERTTLALLANGKSNKEVACEMGVGTRTVETYRASLMLKLSIRSLAGLVKYAIRNHLASVND